jgi:hypothetical protein
MAIHRVPGVVIYRGENRREVEVRDDRGVWHYGEQRSWDQGPRRWHLVGSRRHLGSGARGEPPRRFPADRIRPVTP